MAITYPTTLDSFSNPIGTDKVNNAVSGLKHSTQHANANDAIEALEAKVGANSSAVTTSHDYKLSEVTGSDKAVSKTATQTLTNKTLTGATIDADLNTITNIDNADIKSGAAIARNKTASGTADHVLINDGSGVMSSEATLAVTRGGTGASTATVAFNGLSPSTTKGDIIVHNGTDDVRVAVGTNNQVLVADSAQSTGVKWALPSSLGLTKINLTTSSFSSPTTISIPANTLSTNNAIRITILNPRYSGTSGQNVDISISYGGQSVGTIQVAGVSGGTATDQKTNIFMYLSATGATNTQKSFIETFADFYGIGFRHLYVSNNSMTVDSTTSQNIVITKSGAATFNADGVLIELIA